LSMYPETRGRISTVSTAWSRPVNSSQSLTRFSSTCATLTWGGGGAAGPPDLPHPAINGIKQTTIEKPRILLIIRI
jgi:hypothetical protein